MWPGDLQTTNLIIFLSKHIIFIEEVNLTSKFKITNTFKQKYCCFTFKFLREFLLPNLSKSKICFVFI